MKTETLTILEQLSEAINGARKTGRPMYVFRQDERWWYSGKLPNDATEYYIEYPSGHSDRSVLAPDMTTDDWNSFWQTHGGKSAFVPPRKAGRQAAQTKKEPFSIMKHFRKYFMAYCAFAPHVALCLCMLFSSLGGVTHAAMWSLALPVCLVCVPLTLIWVICGLQRATSETAGMIGATMAIEAHFAFYVHLSLISAQTAGDSGLFIFTLVGSLAFSGVALLLLWDSSGVGSLGPGVKA